MSKAYDEDLGMITLESGADLSGSQFLFGKLDASGKLVVAGTKEASLGVIRDKKLEGQSNTLAYRGISRAIAGGTVAIGPVEIGANGKVVTLTDGEKVGTALTTASADGEFVSVLLKNQ